MKHVFSFRFEVLAQVFVDLWLHHKHENFSKLSTLLKLLQILITVFKKCIPDVKYLFIYEYFIFEYSVMNSFVKKSTRIKYNDK